MEKIIINPLYGLFPSFFYVLKIRCKVKITSDIFHWEDFQDLFKANKGKGDLLDHISENKVPASKQRH